MWCSGSRAAVAGGTRAALSRAKGSGRQGPEPCWGLQCAALQLSPRAWSMLSSQVSFLFLSSFSLLFSTESWLTVKLSAVRLIVVWHPAESLHWLLGRSKDSPLLNCLALRLWGHLHSHFFILLAACPADPCTVFEALEGKALHHSIQGPQENWM